MTSWENYYNRVTQNHDSQNYWGACLRWKLQIFFSQKMVLVWCKPCASQVWFICIVFGLPTPMSLFLLLEYPAPLKWCNTSYFRLPSRYHFIWILGKGFACFDCSLGIGGSQWSSTPFLVFWWSCIEDQCDCQFNGLRLALGYCLGGSNILTIFVTQMGRLSYKALLYYL